MPEIFKIHIAKSLSKIMKELIFSILRMYKQIFAPKVATKVQFNFLLYK